MDIISKRDGPRREDVEARRLIEKNRGTIEKLADQFTSGGFSASRKAAEAAKAGPKASGLIMSDLGGPKAVSEPRPYIRISPNRRVVVVDYETSRQMHHLGEIRRVDGIPCFLLATRANGFFSDLDAELAARLDPLDGVPLRGGRTETVLASEISVLLGYDQTP